MLDYIGVLDRVAEQSQILKRFQVFNKNFGRAIDIEISTGKYPVLCAYRPKLVDTLASDFGKNAIHISHKLRNLVQNKDGVSLEF